MTVGRVAMNEQEKYSGTAGYSKDPSEVSTQEYQLTRDSL